MWYPDSLWIAFGETDFGVTVISFLQLGFTGVHHHNTRVHLDMDLPHCGLLGCGLATLGCAIDLAQEKMSSFEHGSIFNECACMLIEQSDCAL